MEISRTRRRDGDRDYQRAYKACISCRQRKAKCDLGTGPDGLLLGPPCARCRREQKQCVFSEKRPWERKKRGAEASEEDDAASRTRRKSSNHALDDQATQLDHDSPLTKGTHTPPSYSYEDRRNRRQSTATLASSMMRTVVASGNDALNILFEAATAHNQDGGEDGSDPQDRTAPSPAGRGTNWRNSEVRRSDIGSSTINYEAPVIVVRPVEISETTKEVLHVWEACRFVKMGWLTAREAVTLIDLFFENMSTLSPILTDFYADHSNHRLLVTRDHVLCCTILMISSRYHVLPGVGGESRNFFIHHRLWQHCQQLIMRLTFGQEKPSKSTIRSIGTIEALLLISEWHPRSLHFPPESDGWDSELTSAIAGCHDCADTDSSPSANRWVEDMIEPAKRSDQMSWMLLGSALSLAHELGIYEAEDSDKACLAGYEGYPVEHMKLRRQRVQRLIYVYINQLAWRIGCMSLMRQSLSHAIVGGQASRQLSKSGAEWLAFMDSWMDLTKLAKSVTDMFFPSVDFARQQLHSGRYIGLLDHFRPLLRQWQEKHLQPQLLNKPFYNDLFIEYHFVRVYTHSVGMQAVVERILADANADNGVEDVRSMTIDPIDYEYIQEVIDGCCQILHKVAQLGDSGALRFSPVRIFLRITSSSIFLMKALSLGTRQAKLGESLDVLEKTIQALRSNALDDIHLGSRYAALLDVHVARLRRNLLASKTKNSRGTTRRSSMGPLSRSEEPAVDMSFLPLNDIAADDWLSLPFDPSMAPFGVSTGGQFPAYEGGALNFIWNLPS